MDYYIEDCYDHGCHTECTVNMKSHKNDREYVSKVIDKVIESGHLYRNLVITDVDRDVYDGETLSDFVDQFGSDEDRLKVSAFIESEIDILLEHLKKASGTSPTKSARTV
jgi:hypothetical protein